jgi:hypothetical protein
MDTSLGVAAILVALLRAMVCRRRAAHEAGDSTAAAREGDAPPRLTAFTTHRYFAGGIVRSRTARSKLRLAVTNGRTLVELKVPPWTEPGGPAASRSAIRTSPVAAQDTSLATVFGPKDASEALPTWMRGSISVPPAHNPASAGRRRR